MTFPIETLETTMREFGLVIAIFVGFGFGFVLERAGFGRSTKLAAQFYLYDMTVFKVMFGAIVTAMLGLVILSAAGYADLAAISQHAASPTFIGPMIVGGLLLGAGFLISGYCPGTSLVGVASGHLDAVAAIFGVALGALLFNVVYPAIQPFYVSGDQGMLFLYEIIGLPPGVVAFAVALAAIGCFIGAERVETLFTRIILHRERERIPALPGRLVFATFGAAAVIGVALVPLGLTGSASAASAPNVRTIDAETLARRIFDEPWALMLVDVRERAAFEASRVPGSESIPLDAIDDYGLAYSPAGRDLILVSDGAAMQIPAAAMAFPGRIILLDGGFPAWKAFAIDEPPPLAVDATELDRDRYAFRSAVRRRMTGAAAAPPPPRKAGGFKAPKKRAGGGCDS